MKVRPDCEMYSKIHDVDGKSKRELEASRLARSGMCATIRG